jgi:hypothetical protein
MVACLAEDKPVAAKLLDDIGNAPGRAGMGRQSARPAAVRRVQALGTREMMPQR